MRRFLISVLCVALAAGSVYVSADAKISEEDALQAGTTAQTSAALVRMWVDIRQSPVTYIGI